MSTRAKQAILGGVIAAILYLLISPLPEFDAGHVLHFLPELMFLILLLLMFPLAAPLPSWLRLAAVLGDRDILLAQTCVRLC